MATVSVEEYQSVFSELQGLKEKFLALEQENQHLLEESSTNLLRKAANATTTWGTSVTRATVEATIVAIQQGPSTQGIDKEQRSAFPWNSMERDHNLEDSLTRYD